MAPKDYDFCGWVTKNDLRCSDGRTIKKDAFAHQDGAKVPMVWMHNHDSADAVIGYTILENCPEGVKGYSYCNDTPAGQHALEAVRHGDIDSYSIYANRLMEKSANVMHGFIREVSLVYTPANDGARITDVSFAHSDGNDSCTYDAIIVTGESEMEMYHADNANDENEEQTVGDVLDEMSEDQKKVVAFLIAKALEEAGVSVEDTDAMEHSYDDDEYYEGETEMKTNVFDNEPVSGGYLTHADFEVINSEAKSGRATFGEAYEAYIDEIGLSHAEGDIVRSEDKQTYGVNDPSFLFPEARSLNNPPEWIKRDTDWVSVVMNGTHHSPFSRIKSQFADITADEARAKGYLKGNKKEEEVFTLLKRVTTPQTIFKKQKLDRDDVIDITDFDVVSWIRGEMRMMLDEEIARAVLLGDGRSTASNDHISEDHIRPIWKDDDLFTIRKNVTIGADNSETAKNMIKDAIRARKDYKGSGTPVCFTTEDWLTEMLLLDDGIGHPLYKTEAELATRMRVSKFVTVPVMETIKNDLNGKVPAMIIVNLADYNIGADKGGAVSTFEDFDIDYNQMKYLIETRCSGALTKPKSAIALMVPKAADPSENGAG
ncbi:MAG: phage major capsid protein [Prevotellaceae bacterium]|nr:phage major capsid protein [Candidatus Faecinaster equi]